MRIIFLSVITCLVAGLALSSKDESDIKDFHTPEELVLFEKSILVNDSFIVGRNDLFAASGECSGCHGFDPAGIASVDADGNDINVADSWKATMMANSSKDPFWRAKVSHEALIASSDIQAEIESSCTDCHAPLGFYNAMHLGQPHYTLADLSADSVGMDGVSCAACHQISPDGVGTTFSGIDINYAEDTLYGPYEDPFAGPMVSFVGFAPVYSEHIQRSEVCASCHTLITETVGMDGNLTGGEFVEQATYHEWLNSSYNTETESAMECQGCHMTRVDDDVVIASNLLFLPPRSPFFKHDIVGGNTFMLDMMQANRDTLDIRANDEQYEAVKQATLDLLQQETLDIAVSDISTASDTLKLDVELTNKAGHKFPSAYPSRIAYVQCIAIAESGDTLFASGLLGDDYEVIGRDFEFETHHDIIRAEDEVQVYELVVADETGAETTVLSQADFALKDNRLAPFGFTDTHSAYDTTRYYGAVLNDDDFNLNSDGSQGSGKDNIEYHIDLDGYSGVIDITVSVFYQVTPPRWLESMFAMTSDDIELFRVMYDAADKDPVMVVTQSIQDLVLGVDSDLKLENDIIVFPNPTYTGEIAIRNKSNVSVDSYIVYDASGRQVMNEQVRGNTVYLTLPEQAGVYHIVINSDGSSISRSVLRY